MVNVIDKEAPAQDAEYNQAEAAENHYPNRASWTFNGKTVMKATEAYEPAHREAVRWLFFHCIDRDISRADAARAVGRDPATIYKVCTGRYPSKLDNIIADILEWKKREEVAALQSDVPFVDTSIAKRIFKTCESAWTYQTTGFLWGESQTGKTTALEQFQRLNNHGLSRYIRLPAGGSKMGVLRRIAKASAVSPGGSYDYMVDNIVGATDSTNLLIFDEVHQVFTTYNRFKRLEVLEMIREIGDLAHCGVVFCGTNVLRDELMHGEAKKLLEQFRRRGVFTVQLPDHAPIKDLDGIAKAFSLPPAKGEARELIKHINQTSGLKQYTTFLRMAVRLSESECEPINWSHFVRAYDLAQSLTEQ